MAKYKRKVVGSIILSDDPNKPNYIKFRLKDGPLTLKDGQTLSAETKKFQLQSVEKAQKEGKLSGDIADSIKERISKIPDFVLAELILLEKNDKLFE